jgi:adenosylcobinamide-phosphate synthase
MTDLCHALVLALALPLALLLDALMGEPPVRMHPVVWMGWFLGRVGAWLAPDATTHPPVEGRADWPRFWLGALVWSAGAAGVVALACALQYLLWRQPLWLAVPMMALLFKPLMAWRMLRDEVQAVEAALAQSLDAGRARLSWLVSRDVSALSASEVRESAIESLAENFNDSVIAPVLWFALGGLPAAALYRYANTADAMWGYPGWRGQPSPRYWAYAGKWAARADDLLSWLPARASAALLMLAVGAGFRPMIWRSLRQEAAKTPSPNGGWPTSALALGLGVRLAKPGAYHLNPQGAEVVALDTERAVHCVSRALVLSVVMIEVVLLGLVWAGLAS